MMRGLQKGFGNAVDRNATLIEPKSKMDLKAMILQKN